MFRFHARNSHREYPESFIYTHQTQFLNYCPNLRQHLTQTLQAKKSHYQMIAA